MLKFCIEVYTVFVFPKPVMGLIYVEWCSVLVHNLQYTIPIPSTNFILSYGIGIFSV